MFKLIAYFCVLMSMSAAFSFKFDTVQNLLDANSHIIVGVLQEHLGEAQGNNPNITIHDLFTHSITVNISGIPFEIVGAPERRQHPEFSSTQVTSVENVILQDSSSTFIHDNHRRQSTFGQGRTFEFRVYFGNGAADFELDKAFILKIYTKANCKELAEVLKSGADITNYQNTRVKKEEKEKFVLEVVHGLLAGLQYQFYGVIGYVADMNDATERTKCLIVYSTFPREFSVEQIHAIGNRNADELHEIWEYFNSIHHDAIEWQDNFRIFTNAQDVMAYAITNGLVVINNSMRDLSD